MNLQLSKRKKRVAWIILIWLGAWAVFDFSQPLTRTLFLHALKHPFLLVRGIRREAGALFFFHHYYQEYQRLERENGLLQQQVLALEENRRENNRLRVLLSLKDASEGRMIASKVIAHPLDTWSSGIIIDRGSARGIKVGMPVVTYRGLAGRVMETVSGASKIMLISDPNLGVSSMVERSRQEGLITGTLGGYLTMKYLPQGADIEVGDTIITSGLNGKYPKGILIGKVIELGTEFSGLSRYAVVEPAVNLSNIEEVLVVSQ
ncbi:MAG: rod shape-determining protein MreC [Candidatus Omnitrophica bacterium]|nr:rod shape-determining protein MreC [Candidatus Omnitrophota bacterium]